MTGKSGRKTYLRDQGDISRNQAFLQNVSPVKEFLESTLKANSFCEDFLSSKGDFSLYLPI